jgi:hypothetical protein
MTADDIRSKAFEWACDYKPFNTDLGYSKYAEEGYVQGYLQAKNDLERQIEEAREFLKEAYELLEYGIEDNEDVIWCDKYNEKLKEKGE